MTGSELVEETQFIIQDASYDESRILGYINEGLYATAARVDIPDLEQVSLLDTVLSVESASLPSDYMRDLKYVFSATHGERISEPNRAAEYLKFRRRHPVSASGYRVVDVGVRARRLYYYPIPETVESLELTYFKKPETITFSNTPESIPSHLRRRLLCSYASWVIYAQIEDGIEGPQVNTDRQWRNYVEAVNEFVDYIGETDSEPGYIADDYNVEVQ